jgi:cytochrome c5
MKFIYPVLLLTVLVLHSMVISSLHISLNHRKVAALCSSLCLIALPVNVNAQNLDNGEALFISSCSGCHAGTLSLLFYIPKFLSITNK